MKCICVVTQKAYVVFKVYSIPVLINPDVEFFFFLFFVFGLKLNVSK